jgi:hypothetical protein
MFFVNSLIKSLPSPRRLPLCSDRRYRPFGAGTTICLSAQAFTGSGRAVVGTIVRAGRYTWNRGLPFGYPFAFVYKVQLSS